MKIVGFYQFHEVNQETGELENLYCIVEQDEKGNYTSRYIADFDQANIELVNFYRSMGYKSVDELLEDKEHFGRQLNNQIFRKKLEEVYGIDTSDTENFFEKLESLEEEEKLPIKNLNVRNGFFHKLVNKIKQYKKRVIAGVAAVAVIAGSIFGCHLNRESKTGDAVAIVDTNKEDDLEQEIVSLTKEEEMNEMIENTYDEKIKSYMKNFRDRIFGFNKLASKYVDSKNRTLGLTTGQLTAKDMAILGDQFGNTIDNMRDIKDPSVYNTNFRDADKVITQASLLETTGSGLWSHFPDTEIAKFATKYESSIVALNQADTKDAKKKHTEDFLKMVEKDFGINKKDFNAKETLQNNKKLLAVMPIVKAFVLKAENSIKDTDFGNAFEKIEKAYNEVSEENIKKAIKSLTPTENSNAYEDYMEKIKAAMEEKEIYPSLGVADLSSTKDYQEALKLPKIENEDNIVSIVPVETPITTPSPLPVVEQPTVEPIGIESNYDDTPSYSYEDDSSYSSDPVDSEVPDYTTDDENFEYEGEKEEEVPTETPEVTLTPDEADDTLQKEIDDANQAIDDGGKGKVPEDFEGAPGVVDENGYFDGSIEDITTDNSGVVESEEEVDQNLTPQESTADASYEVTESEENYATSDTTDVPVEEVPVVEQEAPSVEAVAEQAVERMANGEDATIVYNVESGNYDVTVEPTVEEEANYTK